MMKCPRQNMILLNSVKGTYFKVDKIFLRAILMNMSFKLIHLFRLSVPSVAARGVVQFNKPNWIVCKQSLGAV